MALIPLFFKDSRFKVLVQQANSFSDAVLALPVIAALAQNYKFVQISVMCSPESAELFSNHPNVESVLVVQKNELGMIRNRDELEVMIRAENPDLYLELWPNFKLSLLARQCGIRVRIGDTTAFFPPHFFTHGVRSGREIMTRHVAEMALKILDRLGNVSRLPHLKIPVEKALLESAAETLRPFRENGAKVIGIDVSTDPSGVALPPPILRELIQKTSGPLRHFILVGRSLQPELLSDLAGPYVHLFWDRSISETFALISQTDAFIGNSSGYSQMASFAQRPMLMFLPRKSDFPTRLGPISSVFKVLRSEFMCSHSPKAPCDPDQCFKWLSSELLSHELAEILRRNETPHWWHIKAIKTQHLMSSIRALWVVSSPEDYFKVVALKSELAAQGLEIVPFQIKAEGWGSIMDMLHLCEQYNITIIHGKVNPVVASILRFILGVAMQSVIPRFLFESPLRQRRNAENWLRIYHHLWDPAGGA